MYCFYSHAMSNLSFSNGGVLHCLENDKRNTQVGVHAIEFCCFSHQAKLAGSQEMGSLYCRWHASIVLSMKSALPQRMLRPCLLNRNVMSMLALHAARCFS